MDHRDRQWKRAVIARLPQTGEERYMPVPGLLPTGANVFVVFRFESINRPAPPPSCPTYLIVFVLFCPPSENLSSYSTPDSCIRASISPHLHEPFPRRSDGQKFATIAGVRRTQYLVAIAYSNAYSSVPTSSRQNGTFYLPIRCLACPLAAWSCALALVALLGSLPLYSQHWDPSGLCQVELRVHTKRFLARGRGELESLGRTETPDVQPCSRAHANNST